MLLLRSAGIVSFFNFVCNILEICIGHVLELFCQRLYQTVHVSIHTIEIPQPTSNFQPVGSLDPGCGYKFKQCRSRSVDFFRSHLIWIYTVCKGRAYQGSAGPGLR